ncbi:MAG: tyrosine-protein phosphatase [Cyanobacteriota bacterium]
MKYKYLFIWLLMFSIAILIPFNCYSEDSENIIKTLKTKNFHKVDENYYRGANPPLEDYEKLGKLGIKSIIDLRHMNNKKFTKLKTIANQYGIKYYSIQMSPFTPPTKEQIKEFFDIVNNPDGQPVYVHCTYGKDRTGIMSALYRVNNYQWEYDQAYQEMISDGYHVHLYGNQKKFLYEYTHNKPFEE